MPLPSGLFDIFKPWERVEFHFEWVRVFTILLGLSGVVWGATNFATLWRQLGIERIAAKILDRETFKPNALVPFIPALEEIEQSHYCRPQSVRSAAIIRLRLAEEALAAGERATVDERLSTLDSSIRKALACEPADPFLWMVLAWLGNTREGFKQEQLAYLRLSYRLGPNEGWIAARRNRLSLAMFQRLPPDLASDAVDEFAHMLNSWLYWETIAVFTGPGWPVRERLLDSLKHVGERQRDAFAKELYTEGYNVIVPGIAPREPRPWY
jgi:hypothetical protein